jgi:hypothetical protein
MLRLCYISLLRTATSISAPQSGLFSFRLFSFIVNKTDPDKIADERDNKDDGYSQIEINLHKMNS